MRCVGGVTGQMADSGLKIMFLFYGVAIILKTKGYRIFSD